MREIISNHQSLIASSRVVSLDASVIAQVDNMPVDDIQTLDDDQVCGWKTDPTSGQWLASVVQNPQVMIVNTLPSKCNHDWLFILLLVIDIIMMYNINVCNYV